VKNLPRRVVLALGAASLLCASGALAQPAAEFYKGKSVTLVVSSSPGGGYDIMSRTIAKYLGNHLPGNPRVLVQNMPGAGGIVAMNYFYTNAPKDGTYLGAVQNNTPFEPLLGTREAKYDPTKFNWLGSPSTEVGLIAVWRNVPVNTLADLKRREITVGSSGANSTPSFYARLINETLGTKMRIVVGYPGQNEVYFAMERGEVDGFPSLFYNTLNSTRPAWRKEKNIKLILQYGLEKEPEIAEVPNALDLVTDPELLLLDEPFAALDEITRFRLNEDLLRLWEARHWTVIFVTHSVFESAFLSSRVVVMAPRPGRVVADLPVDLPYPREGALRTSVPYATFCRGLSERLAGAMA